MTHKYDARLVARAHEGRKLVRRGDDPLTVLAAVVWPRPEATSVIFDEPKGGEHMDTIDNGKIWLTIDPAEFPREMSPSEPTFEETIPHWDLAVTDDGRIGVYQLDDDGRRAGQARIMFDPETAQGFVQKLQRVTHELGVT